MYYSNLVTGGKNVTLWRCQHKIFKSIFGCHTVDIIKQVKSCAQGHMTLRGPLAWKIIRVLLRWCLRHHFWLSSQLKQTQRGPSEASENCAILLWMDTMWMFDSVKAGCCLGTGVPFWGCLIWTVIPYVSEDFLKQGMDRSYEKVGKGYNCFVPLWKVCKHRTARWQ